MLINFRAINISNAFILNSIVISLIALISIEVDLFIKNRWNYQEPSTFFSFDNIIRILISLLISFLSALFVFWMMYFIFGFGGGLLAPKVPMKSAFQNVQ